VWTDKLMDLSAWSTKVLIHSIDVLAQLVEGVHGE